MTVNIINPPGGLDEAAVLALIATHLSTAPHFSQVQIQSLIDASVNSAIANLMIPTYGNNFQGIRDDTADTFTGGAFTDTLSHTVTNVNNGEWHTVIMSAHWMKTAQEDVQLQATLNGAPLDIPMDWRASGDTNDQSYPVVMMFNVQLSAGDVLALQRAENNGGTATVENRKIVLFESAQLDVAAAPPAFNVSTPGTRFVATFWNQMAGDPNGSAQTTINPTVVGGVGPFTFSWALSNFSGTGSPNPSLTAPTAQNGTAQVDTSAISYSRTFDMTVTVTDVGTGLVDSSTTQVTFVISETSN